MIGKNSKQILRINLESMNQNIQYCGHSQLISYNFSGALAHSVPTDNLREIENFRSGYEYFITTLVRNIFALNDINCKI